MASSEASGGDLAFSVGCVAIVGSSRGYGAPTYTGKLKTKRGPIVREHEFSGGGYNEIPLMITVSASPYDRLLECFLSVSYAADEFPAFDLEDYAAAIVQNSGPTSLRITGGAFIPDEWIWGPTSAVDDLIYEGDNRGFSEYAGTARAASIIEVANPAYSSSTVVSGPDHYAGFSVEYEYSTSVSGGHLTAEAKGDWTPGRPMKTAWATASTDSLSCQTRRLGPDPARAVTRMSVVCTGAVNNPVVFFSPAIDYRFEIALTFGRGQVAYTLTGCHDGFPAFETYVGGQTAFAQMPIHGSVWWLFETCDHSIPPISGVVR